MLMNELDEVVHVSDIETHELLYVNKIGKRLFGLTDDIAGSYCYTALKGYKEPCPNCDNCKLKHSEVRKEEEYNARYKKYFLKTQKLIYWEGREARMEVDIDVTDSHIVRAELDDRLQTEYLLIDSINRINSAEDLEDEVRKTLETLGRFFGSDRADLIVADGGAEEMETHFLWTKSGVISGDERKGSLAERLPYWKRLYKRYKNGVLLEAKNLKTTAPEIWRKMRKWRIQRMMSIACIAPGDKVGYLCIENPRRHVAGCSLLSTYLNFVLDELLKSQIQKELEHLSFYDELTDVGNRRRYRKFQNELSQMKYSTLGIAVMNVNGMNEFNNTYGQRYGDSILKSFANQLCRLFARETIFRTSGDEFVVFCPEVGRDEINARICALKEYLRENAYYSVAIGYSWDDSGISHRIIFESAVEYMHLDKREYYINGKRKTKGFENKALEAVLRCIKSGNFKVYFQPKVDITTEMIIGAEALVRYEDQEYGVVGPDRFIAQLEKEKNICYLDTYIFKQVGDLLETWYQEKRPLMTISLNFSRMTLTWPRLMKVMEEARLGWHFPMEYMEIEITESVGEVGKQTMVLLVKQLKSMGLRVSLDDFGVQYTNLSVLTNVDFDVLKLDKTLIDDISVNYKSEIIVRSVVDVCRQIHTKCLAEGVETRGQFEQLRSMGCDYIQGYLFGRPMPKEDFVSLISR